MIGEGWEPNPNHWARPKLGSKCGTPFGSTLVDTTFGSYFLGLFCNQCGQFDWVPKWVLFLHQCGCSNK